MQPFIIVQFRMKRGNEPLALAGCHDRIVNLSPNLAVGRQDDFDIWCSDESHLDMLPYALHSYIGVKTARLPSVSIATNGLCP